MAPSPSANTFSGLPSSSAPPWAEAAAGAQSAISATRAAARRIRMPPRVSKPSPMVLQRLCRCQVRPGPLGGPSYASRVRCFIEPSPAGGYFVRLRGEPAPVSHHDTEEEAEAAAAAYERGLADAAEHLTLDDGADVVVRAEGEAFVAF